MSYSRSFASSFTEDVASTIKQVKTMIKESNLGNTELKETKKEPAVKGKQLKGFRQFLKKNKESNVKDVDTTSSIYNDYSSKFQNQHS